MAVYQLLIALEVREENVRAFNDNRDNRKENKQRSLNKLNLKGLDATYKWGFLVMKPGGAINQSWLKVRVELLIACDFQPRICCDYSYRMKYPYCCLLNYSVLLVTL